MLKKNKGLFASLGHPVPAQDWSVSGWSVSHIGRCTERAGGHLLFLGCVLEPDESLLVYSLHDLVLPVLSIFPGQGP